MTDSYPPFFTAAEKGGHDVCAVPLTVENNFMPDISKVTEMLQANHRLNDLNALFINYPHNPTGAVANYKYLESIIALARKYNFLVVSDMAYSEIYDPSCEKPHSIFEVPGAKEVDDFKRSGFFLWVRVPENNMSSKEFFSRLLYNAGIVTVPGNDFGEEGEGYMRISLTQPIPVLEAVLKRLEVNGFDYNKLGLFST